MRSNKPQTSSSVEVNETDPTIGTFRSGNTLGLGKNSVLPDTCVEY
jgi:hypothetical protein